MLLALPNYQSISCHVFVWDRFFWCKIFLLSNRMFLISELVSERRWLVRGWMAAILAVMFKWLFIWMECELNCQSYDNKPCNWSQCPLMPAGLCSLSWEKWYCPVPPPPRCLETKTINTTISVRDDHKLTLLLPQVARGSLPINKSNYITTLQSCLASIVSDVCVYKCSLQSANWKTQQNDQ